MPNGELSKDIYTKLARYAHICYAVEDSNRKPEDMLKFLIANGHESVLEHEKITVIWECDRGVSHEIVRHRIASYCLPGDVVVLSDRANRSVKKRTISSIVEMNKTAHGRSRLKILRIRSIDPSGNVASGKITDIIDSGIQKVYNMKTKLGYSLPCTENHRISTPKGFTALKDLTVGDIVFVNGIEYFKDAVWLTKKWNDEKLPIAVIAELAGVSYSTVRKYIRKYSLQKPLGYKSPDFKPWNKGLTEQDDLRVKNQGDALRKYHHVNLSGESNSCWRGDTILPNSGRLRTNKLYKLDGITCELCGKGPAEERHHIDKNPKNNNRENIALVCINCHKLLHNSGTTRHVITDTITSIDLRGEEQTYDLTIDPHHNFVANGVIVHNSQESTRYVTYDDIAVIKPYDLTDEQFPAWRQAQFDSEDAYMRLIENGCRAQIARGALTNSLRTRIVITANIREWRHILTLRAVKEAHPQMQQMAIPTLLTFANKYDILFADIQYNRNFESKFYSEVIFE